MKQPALPKSVFLLSLVQAMLLILISLTGMFTPEFYVLESRNWQIQSIGQDMADLFIALPVLLLTAFPAYRGRRGALFIWAGVNMFLLYTFLIYCFAIHFNKLFLFYCFSLSLAFYNVVWFFLYSIKFSVISPGLFANVPRRVTAVYCIVLSVVFYVLWLSEIIPAVMRNEPTESIKQTGLVTNPVHVIDLAVILPGMFITGLFLHRRKVLGYVLAPVFLTFFILMDITIGGLVLLMIAKGLPGNYGVAAAMGVLTLFTSILLFYYIKKTGETYELQ